MSNKLTREVVYLSESDRPKKVEPLSFFDYSKNFLEPSQTTIEFVEWDIKLLNEYALKYATYLQEFSAEEKGVEFTHCLQNSSRFNFMESTFSVQDSYKITHIGKYKNHETYYDMFKVERGVDTIYFLGKLNSGHY